MSNVAIALKQEITRLARKEARSLTRSLYKASAQFRRDIAELKRQNAKARVEIARLERARGEKPGAQTDESGADRVRFSSASVKSQRRRLGLSAADFGRLIGVTGHTVYSWEHGGSRPRSAQLAAFAALRTIGRREAGKQLEALQQPAPKPRRPRTK